MLLTSCGTERADRTGSAESKPQAVERLEVSAGPIVTIGREGDPAYEFDEIAGIGRLSSGEWFVFDRGSNQIRFYDAAGRFLSSTGRSGEGPGEFLDVRFAGLGAGDTIFIYDQRLRRLSWFDARGELLGSNQLPVPPGGTVLYAVGPAGAGTFAWFNVVVPTCRPGGLLVDTAQYFRQRLGTSDAAEAGPLARIHATPAATRWGNTLNLPGLCLASPIPFSRWPVAATRDERLYIGSRDRLSVTVLDLSTGRAQVVAADVPREPLTRAMIEEHVAAELARTAVDELGRPLPTPSGMHSYAQRLRETPYPDSLSAMDQLRVDPSGHVWVRRYPAPGVTTAEWWVFSPAGQLAARLELPAALRVMDLGHETVAGVHTDQLGIERVHVYGLKRTRTPRRDPADDRRGGHP